MNNTVDSDDVNKFINEVSDKFINKIKELNQNNSNIEFILDSPKWVAVESLIMSNISHSLLSHSEEKDMMAVALNVLNSKLNKTVEDKQVFNDVIYYLTSFENNLNHLFNNNKNTLLNIIEVQDAKTIESLLPETIEDAAFFQAALSNNNPEVCRLIMSKMPQDKLIESFNTHASVVNFDIHAKNNNIDMLQFMIDNKFNLYSPMVKDKLFEYEIELNCSLPRKFPLQTYPLEAAHFIMKQYQPDLVDVDTFDENRIANWCRVKKMRFNVVGQEEHMRSFKSNSPKI